MNSSDFHRDRRLRDCCMKLSFCRSTALFVLPGRLSASAARVSAPAHNTLVYAKHTPLCQIIKLSIFVFAKIFLQSMLRYDIIISVDTFGVQLYGYQLQKTLEAPY